MRGSLFWVASGVLGVFSGAISKTVCTGMDIAHRRLTPDFTFFTFLLAEA